jgi:hypothetical protein
MLNETIVAAVNGLTPEGSFWLINILALIGFCWILQTLSKTGINLVYVVAYFIGLGKWIYLKIKRVKK